jgi:hypothetical protein
MGAFTDHKCHHCRHAEVCNQSHQHQKEYRKYHANAKAATKQRQELIDIEVGC